MLVQDPTLLASAVMLEVARMYDATQRDNFFMGNISGNSVKFIEFLVFICLPLLFLHGQWRVLLLL